MTKVVPLPASFHRPEVATGVGLGVLFQAEPPSLDALQQALQASGLSMQVVGGDGLGGIANGVTVVVKPMHERLPGDLEMGAHLALTWPELPDLVDSYRSGVMIAAQAGDDVDPFELHGIAMMTAAAVAGMPGALAVYNDDSRVFSRPDDYRAILHDVFNGSVPTMHWFAVWPATSRTGDLIVITNGLQNFGIPELAVSGDVDLADATAALSSFAYDAVARLRTDRNDFLKPGDTVTVFNSAETATVAALNEGGYTVGSIEVSEPYYEIAYRNEAYLDHLFGDNDEASSSGSGHAGGPHSAASATPQNDSAASQPARSTLPQSSASAAAGESQPQKASLPQHPARGLVLLGAPIDLTQVARELQQRGFEVTRVEGPQLDARAGAFIVSLSGRPGQVPEYMWTVQPPQAVCFNHQMPPQVCHVYVEVTGREGGHAGIEQQRLALEHTLSAVASRQQAVAVVLENDTQATPAQAFVAAHR